MKYEYMKEYETNGQRPEGLADDVVIECFDGIEWWGGYDQDSRGRKAGRLKFDTNVTQKFRIVDERFKPESNNRHEHDTFSSGDIMKYEYMKEYEVSGRLPGDLADDVLVQWKPLDADTDSRWLPCLLNNSITVGDLYWVGQNCVPVGKFRIIDKRFEHPNMVYGVGLDKSPRGVIANKPTSDTDVGSNWHERGERPPVGEVVEYYSSEMTEWRKCNIGAHWKNGVIIVDAEDDGCEITYTHNLRPIRTERDKLIEHAIKALGLAECGTTCGYKLIKGGWRPIKQQSEKEFVGSAYEAGCNCPQEAELLYRAGCRFIEREG